MSDDGRFDPRFDRAFQPGYDGVREAVEPGMASSAAGYAEPASQVLPEADTKPDTEPEPEPEPQPEPEFDGATPPLRNRYLIALGALAVALLITGIVLIGFVRTIFDNRTEDLDYVTVQLLLVSGPIAIGLAVAIGASFLMMLGLRSKV